MDVFQGSYGLLQECFSYIKGATSAPKSLADDKCTLHFLSFPFAMSDDGYIYGQKVARVVWSSMPANKSTYRSKISRADVSIAALLRCAGASSLSLSLRRYSSRLPS